MSYDLRVFAPKRLKKDLREALINSMGLRSVGPSVEATLVVKDESAAVEFDGPIRIEAEDLPEAANGAIKKAGWLVELSVKASAEEAWPFELAESIARTVDGVVFDPQRDAVVWPVRWQPTDSERRLQLIDVIELEVFTAASDPRWLATRLLEILSESRPDALPRRYGDFEPYQNRFEGEHARREFVAYWQDASPSLSPTVTWSATAPCFFGSMRTSGKRRQRGREDTPACTRISLSFDARPLHRAAAEADGFIDFVESVAGHIQAFYAAAVMTAGVELRRGRIWRTGNSESTPFPRATSWVGLPASPTWIAWFGPPYADLVQPAIGRELQAESDGGFLVRTARQPLDRSHLARIFPPLPEKLLARSQGEPGRWLPDASYTLFSGPPSEPAEYIPELTGSVSR
jgi:hypothetical protein